ncbi:MFS transporter [Nocardioides sp.]|uniref:MFS transporter n=1 Tax=Nocardioides sp. TaxID=35761 RepID=UPI00271E301E|nr:MFS transporter [Nocardioides sp.]MDO9456701.1 MFS transporter [Nocardioides sp.]
MTARVGWVFAVNGFLFASLVSRVPDLRAGLDLDNSGLGLLLLAIAVGSLTALPAAGALIARWGAATVVRGGALLDAVGLVLVAVGAGSLGSVPVTAAGLLLYGAGVGVWDVAMNVEGAEVERRLGRTVMPRFHAGFSLGTVAGALLGVLVVRLDLALVVHLPLLAAVVVPSVLVATAGFLPVGHAPEGGPGSGRAWLEPRTLLVGLLVLMFAAAEGSANDWIAIALVDGHEAAAWAGVAGYSVFVAAMTAGRLAGPVALDRWGRAPVLWTSAALVVAGVLLVVHGSAWPVVAAGCLVWGLGAALGFPVGMSAAADDAAGAAARVSVVSTIGYAAFLGGPPLLGALGDRVGTLDALQVVALLMLPAAVLVLVVRRPVGAVAR